MKYYLFFPTIEHLSEFIVSKKFKDHYTIKINNKDEVKKQFCFIEDSYSLFFIDWEKLEVYPIFTLMWQKSKEINMWFRKEISKIKDEA